MSLILANFLFRQWRPQGMKLESVSFWVPEIVLVFKKFQYHNAIYWWPLVGVWPNRVCYCVYRICYNFFSFPWQIDSDIEMQSHCGSNLRQSLVGDESPAANRLLQMPVANSSCQSPDTWPEGGRRPPEASSRCVCVFISWIWGFRVSRRRVFSIISWFDWNVVCFVEHVVIFFGFFMYYL